MSTGTIDLQAAGQTFQLLPDRAAYWVEGQTLLVADLHWGKDETFRSAGSPVPSGGLTRDLELLSKLVADTGAKRIIVAGDLIHARSGVTRELDQQIIEWRKRTPVEMLVVPGNHDGSLPRVADNWSITRTDPVFDAGPFAVVHEPDLIAGRVTWSGHVHPCVRVPGGGGNASRAPCFHASLSDSGDEGVLVLPAFGSFTGSRAYTPIVADQQSVYAIADGRVMDLGDWGQVTEPKRPPRFSRR